MPELSISSVATTNILPTVPVLSIMKQSCIDIPAATTIHPTCGNSSKAWGLLQPAPDEPCRAQQQEIDARNYPQHRLTDYEDPEVREIKRQENVETTLWMIDVALGLYR